MRTADRRAHSPPVPIRPARSWIGEALFSLVFFTVVSALFLRPWWSVAASRLTPGLGDPLFDLWVLKWGLHQAALGFPAVWDAPIFFPARQTLLMSDHLLGPVLLGYAVGVREEGAAVLYNVLLFTSFVLSGCGAVYACRRAGCGRWGALASGCVFAFSAFRWEQMSHLQMLLMQWIPFTLERFHRLLARPSAATAGTFAALYAVHVSGGSYLAVMIQLPLAVIAMRAVRARRPTGRDWIWLGAAAAVSAAALWCFLGPYLRLEGLARGEEVFHQWGASLVSWLTPSEDSLLWGSAWPAILRRPENALFPGLLPLVALVAAGWHVWRRRLGPPIVNSTARRTWFLAGFALVAAGTALGEAQTWAASPLPLFSVWSSRFDLPFVVLLAGAVALFSSRRLAGRFRWPETLTPWGRDLIVASASTGVASLAYVYAAPGLHLPGFGSMRVPARFDAFTSLGIALVVGLVVDRSLARIERPPLRLAVAAAALVLLLVDLAPRAWEWVPLPPTGEPVGLWIASHPEVRSLVVLPCARGQYESEISVMYRATSHWRPLVNGYSGFLPAAYEKFEQECGSLGIDPEGVRQLAEWGVSHAQWDVARLRRWERKEIRSRMSEIGAQLVYSDPDAWIYALPARDRFRRKSENTARRTKARSMNRGTLD